MGKGEGKMENAIKEYLTLTDEEKEKLWKNAVFVFDTNIFLACYKFSKSLSKSILDAIESVKEQIWIPKQVAVEFAKNRYCIMLKNEEKLEKLNKNISDIITEIKSSVNKNESANDNKQSVAIKRIENALKEGVNLFKKNSIMFDSSRKENILVKILDLFKGKVGEGFDSQTLEELSKEAESRYEKKVPPGYKDKGKDENQYGDFLLWKEIIAYARANKKDIIFVTEDQKEDWFWKKDGKTIGPRYELKREFYNETNQELLMYSLTSFLEYTSKANDKKMNLKELEEISKNRDNEINLHNRLIMIDQQLQRWDQRLIRYNYDIEEIEREIKRLKIRKEKILVSMEEDFIQKDNYNLLKKEQMEEIRKIDMYIDDLELKKKQINAHIFILKKNVLNLNEEKEKILNRIITL